MTLYALQQVLGENIERINDYKMDDEEMAKTLEKADMISRLAKQMINNADVILRTDKLVSDGKLRSATILQLVGGVTKNGAEEKNG